MRHCLLLLFVLLAQSAAAFADDAPGGATFWLKAEVTIEADGSVSGLEWNEERPAARAIIERIEPAVRGWEFAPGTVDGVAAVTRTHLTLRTNVFEERDGISIYIAEVTPGAAAIDAQPPAYPHGALRGGVSAEVVVEIALAADGTVTLVDASFEGSRGTAYRRQFLRAAEHAVRDWSFRLEEVGGHPVATRMSVPIKFCLMPSPWCEERERAAIARPVAPGEALALDSAVRLKSDPRTGI